MRFAKSDVIRLVFLAALVLPVAISVDGTAREMFEEPYASVSIPRHESELVRVRDRVRARRARRTALATPGAPVYPVCDTLFGDPGADNGLPNGASQPFCECGGMSFAPPEYTDADVAELRAMHWQNPMPLLESDPYESPQLYSVVPGEVCGVLIDPDDDSAYRLETYPSEVAAQAAGARVTHAGACGVCSSLENLAVYIGTDDLTGLSRSCAVQSLFSSEADTLECLEDIGFDAPCAQMWAYNIRNTRTVCFGRCATELGASYHNADGTLNQCIQCDEDMSGPIFQAVAGRTRRNSGLPSSLARPCEQVANVVHRYR